MRRLEGLRAEEGPGERFWFCFLTPRRPRPIVRRAPETPLLTPLQTPETLKTPRRRSYHTVELAIRDALRKPPAPFGDAIRAHFKAKRAEVSATLAVWSAEASGDPSMAAHMARVVGEAEAELAKL